MLLVQRCVRLAPRSARLFSSPIQRYTDLVQRGQLRYDGAQVLVLEHLSKLQRVLLKEHKAREKDAALQERYALERDEADDDAAAPPAPRRPRAAGATSSRSRLRKSLCCDLFFGGLPVQRKRRVHFHQFMLEIHERIHAAREAGDARSTRDVIARIGAELAKEAEVLCFDEMQVTDVADAMIAEKLFASCWDAGMILVATRIAAAISTRAA
ncbi:ATP binding protein [Aureococcus anophagefferens]|nr:ATP binding protein [Aureococcus anophagefferens]